jgi:hypothetical protein
MKKQTHETEIDPTYSTAVMSAKLNNDFNLTFVFLYGNYDIKETDLTDDSVTTYDMRRLDSDLALNYRLNSYFKLFVGGKYMGYKYKIDGYDFTCKHASYGPGAGISAVLPLGGDFFLIANFGGLYLWGKEVCSGDDDSPDQDYHEYGFNTSASIAYYIEPASTTINLGGRYQYIITKYDSSNPDPDDKLKYYGITLSATYSFGI